ncbi:MAG: DUF1501 domain-containing protein [Bryobacteraceae bacterium]|nr:DUF1501 domain-containing protein [Bryobacteraceae bacterium]
MLIKPPQALSTNAHAQKFLTRRALLRQTACGFGTLGLTGMMAAAGPAKSANPLAVRPPHFAPKAKRVIFLFMHGGPSSIDTFDPKPKLAEMDGKPLPFKRPLTFAEGKMGGLMKSPWEFKQHGQSGIPVSSLFPHVASVVDDLCIVRSVVGDSVAHGGASLQLHTGSNTFTRPSMGSWVVYGLGSENQNLPGYITIKPSLAHGGAKNWASGFLPAAYQGTAIGNAGIKLAELTEPIEYLTNKGYTPEQQRYELDMLQKMNRAHALERELDPELEGRIEAFELAARMQTEAPEAFEVEKESEATKKLYGYDKPETKDFAWQCMLARRLVERGVRFAQCSHSYKWDQHSELVKLHTRNAREVDQPIAALIKDLKSRDLLKDTLVLWGAEFGRTPVAEGGDGRDHNPYGYTMWMAGGGVKPGMVYGATDEFGYYAVEDRMHIHDLHATMLHLLGFNHEQLTYRYAGRNFRLTDVAGQVAHKIIA